MASLTSGGLRKSNVTLDRECDAAVAEVAGDKYSGKMAPAIRELIKLGFKVYRRRKALNNQMESLAVDMESREVA